MFSGITDPASIVFRRESELLAGCEDPGQPYLTWVLPEKARTAEECVTQRSLALNLSPRGRTLGAVFFSGTAPPALRPCLKSGKGIASGFEEPRRLVLGVRCQVSGIRYPRPVAGGLRSRRLTPDT